MVTLSLGWKIYIVQPWGKPSGMWTQMVLNFHIFNFYTTQFSHITYATLKCLSHTRSGIPHTCSLMRAIWGILWLHRQPATAWLQQGPFFSCLKFFCVFLLHLTTIVCKANKRRKLSLVNCSSYYISLAALGCDWSYFCFMSMMALHTTSFTSQYFFRLCSVSPAQSLLAPSQSYVWWT